eukprot:01925.XXX_4611_15385_1 [CDS] Oithona nana genome sequencing.
MASRGPRMSLFNYLVSEVTRGYVLENDEERYTHRREKMYTFMKIPRELEKFMSYGFFHCLDSFLFVFTFLPIRFMMALFKLIFKLILKPPLSLLRLYRSPSSRLLFPAEIIDLLKGFLIGLCVYVMSHIDTSMIYHIIKSQSVIKLYLFYNMLEVGDRLLSAFGQDTIDALFWTATERHGRKREHVAAFTYHSLWALVYVFCHTVLVLLQATTLNVAINASNKALLTIMMSNNFVELKGSVFKKFDKNNLFQVSCSDVRERFHLFALLFLVVVQTMKEYGWREESFWNLAPDCLMVMGAEFLVDWIKHAFITRFNEVDADVYKSYTIFLAYDLAQTKQKHAFSDHSDIVSRRMGFIPLPLSVVMIRVISTAVRAHTQGSIAIFLLAYLSLVTFRVLASIVILGKACDLIDQHQEQKKASTASMSSASATPKKTSNNTNHATTTAEMSSTSPEAVQPQQPQLRPKIEKEKVQDEAAASSPPPLLRQPGSQVTSAEDISLLEAKLQRIDATRAFPNSPSAPVLAEDNLDPINEELEDNVTQLNHRWSNNRRSQLLKHHQGELNRVVFSDSRRRPLSCTPPSTSISTSVSIDEDEPPNQISHQQEPQIVLTKEDDNEEQEVEEDEDEELRQLDMEAPLLDQPMRPKALSSPDFMNVYKPAFDEERDWPPLDDVDDEVDHEKNGYEDITDGSIDSIRRRKSFTRKRLDTDRI